MIKFISKKLTADTKKILVGVITKFLTLPLSLCVSIVLTRNLGQAQFGLYSLLLSLIMLFTNPIQYSLSTVIVRESSVHVDKEEFGVVKGLIVFAVMLALFMSLIAYISLDNIAYYFYDIKLNIGAYVFALIVFALILNSAGGTFLRSFGYIIIGILPEQVIRPLLITVVISIMIYLSGVNELTVTEGLYCLLISALLSILFIFIFGCFHLAKKLRAQKLRIEWKTWSLSMLPLLSLGIFQVVNTNIPIFMLGYLSTDESIAMYKISGQCAVLVGVTLVAVNLVIGPKLSVLISEKNILGVQKILKNACAIAFFFSSTIAVVYYFFGENILITAFGKDYADAYYPLLILAAGQLVNAFTGPVGLTLNLLRQEKFFMKVMIFTGIFNAFLSWYLIYNYGILGAAAAAAISITISNVLLTIKLFKHSGISIIPFLDNLKTN